MGERAFVLHVTDLGEETHARGTLMSRPLGSLSLASNMAPGMWLSSQASALHA